MDSPFMNDVASGIGNEGIRVARFEFPYMAQRREGRRKGPDRPAILEATWIEAIGSFDQAETIFIGGKSMGGRIATMVADDSVAAGVICYGYPFHPPGKPQQTRISHLETLRVPALILQGTRDPFGKPEEVARYPLSDAIRVEWLEGGDHSYKAPARALQSTSDLISSAIEKSVAFIRMTLSK